MADKMYGLDKVQKPKVNPRGTVRMGPVKSRKETTPRRMQKRKLMKSPVMTGRKA